MIVEDEPITSEGLKRFINWEKFNCSLVEIAEDPLEGLYLIENLKPEIIITDIVMPGMSGLEMIRRIKNMNIKGKIILITAYRNLTYAQEAIKLGVFRLLFKPIKIEEVEQSIKEALEEMNIELNLDDVDFKEKIIQTLKNMTRKDKFSFLMNRIVEYIIQNYDKKNLNLMDLSKSLYISYWHLSRIIKKELGITFKQLVNIIRIEKAKILLNNPKYRISDIAKIIGYNDITYFWKMFKKLTGKNPYKYRNEKYLL